MKRTIITLIAIMFPFVANELAAHPGSGIVVDRQGNIYFVDTGSGVYKIDRNGKLTRLSGPAYHWMAIDADNRLKNATLPYFSSGDATVTRVGVEPTLLLSSDFPVTVGREGNLYYPWLVSEQLKVFRLAPSGTTAIHQALPTNTESGPLRWLNGIVAAPDGSLYYTEDRTVKRISPQGKLTVVADNVTLSACDSLLPGLEADRKPYFRGLDVDTQGTVYVAASGCRAVLKITADKKITTILRTSSPWSPTGVALFGTDLYVLEYLHTPGDDRREWLPRVRKLTSDGQVVTIATIDRR